MLRTLGSGQGQTNSRPWRAAATPAARWSALAALVTTAALVPGASAAEPDVQSGYVEPVLGEPVPVTAAGTPDVDLAALGVADDGHGWQPPAGITWPEPAVTTVDLSAPAAEATVTVTTPGNRQATGRPSSPVSPGAVRVEVLDQAAGNAAGVAGVLVAVDAVSGAGEVELAVDYSGFAEAYGGGWASRLRLVELPACVVSTPQVASCRTPTQLPSVNDTDKQQVSATVQLMQAPASVDSTGGLVDGAGTGSDVTGTVYALTAGESSVAGDYTATDLNASGSWSQGGGSGGFSYGYPLRVPPAAGPVPGVSLGYSSQAHDGLTSGSNNQASWVGDGWGYQPGLIERTYSACARDQAGGNNSVKTGDLCWDGDSPSITLSLNGVNTSLVKDDTSGQWRTASDQGWRIEKLGSPASPSSATSERWRVTTTDGTEYLFAGEASSSQSRWTVPVFGNHSGEPCRSSTFKDSSCRQAYRWMLDKVVDTSGNVTRYFYATATGHYGAAGDAGKRMAYHRAGRLTRIDYGLREGSSGQATARVVFTAADRCLSNCYDSSGNPKPASWPDTPWDLTCNATPCIQQVSPSFFSSKRLEKIITQVWDGSGFDDVDSWQLTHEFKDYGDESQVVLWLKSIQHTGHVGGTATTPSQSFLGWALPNRVDHNGVAAIWRSRLSAITTETGGVTTVNYSDPDCGPGDLPSKPDSNTRLCYPVWWTPQFQSEPELDWFHKYVVESVAEQETTASGDTVWTSYDYSTAGGGTSVLWAWDDGEFTDDKYRTYGQWRGYPQVTTRVGDPAEGSRLTTRTRYYRGMHDQPLPGGGKRSVQLTDSEGNTVTDHRALASAAWEAASLNGTSIDSATTYRYWTRKTATRSHDGGDVEAWLTGVSREDSRHKLTGTTWQRTRVETTFDTRGRVVEVSDLGDTAVTGDEKCARTEYADNTSAWILSAVSRTETVAVACTTNPSRPKDVVNDARTFYDGSNTHGASPSKGLPTKAQVLDSWASGPVYATVSSTSYDALGRPVASTDALGHTSTVGYTPAGAGPLTKTTATNPLGHQTVTELEPAWGQPTVTVDPNGRRTDLAYDPLGRVTAAWLPGRARATQSANLVFGYQVRNNAPSAVTTKRINASGGYVSSVALFDSLLREIQTQADTPLGGRLITETAYDTRGLVRYVSGPNWDESSAPNTTFVRVDQGADHTRSWHTYDGLGREMKKELWSKNVKLWQTTTAYGGSTAGFMVSTTPPDGGVPTATITNALGEMIEKRDYHGATPTGAYDATSHTYDAKGRLSTVTDPAGDSWAYEHDLRGRLVASHDPDSGTSAATYDAAGQITSTTDARGETLSQAYDKLGRVTQRKEGAPGTGKVVAAWTYDTVAGGIGMPATAIAYVGDDEIKAVVEKYDTAGRPTRATTTVPAIPGMEELAGSFMTNQSFNIDGTVAELALPAVGGLPREGITYTHNSFGKPNRMVGNLFTADGEVQTYVDSTTYTAWGELAQRTLAGSFENQVYQTYSYQDGTRRRGEFRLSRDAVGATNVAHLRYDYDHAGNILSIADAVEDDPGEPERQCFVYDHLRRLTEAWAQSGVDPCAAQPSTGAMGGPGAYWSSYTFDVTGNRLSETRHDPSGGSQTSTYKYPAHGGPKPHTLSSVTTSGQANTYTWDAAGNMTSRKVNGRTESIEWNAAGKPAAITDDAGNTTRMLYNQDGDRIARIDGNGDASLFVAGHEITYTKATNTVTAVRSYEHNGDIIATRSTTDGLQWLASDHHGTATWAINAVSMAVMHRRQDPYGNPRDSQQHWPAGQKGFVGGIEDPTGLVHIGARSYDPAIGRFISSDPITDHANPQQTNGYSYAGNSPITNSDPTGLFTVCAPDGLSLCPDQPVKQQPTRKRPSRGNEEKFSWTDGVPTGPASHAPRRPRAPAGTAKPSCPGVEVHGKCLGPAAPQIRQGNLDNGSTELALRSAMRDGATCKLRAHQIYCFEAETIYSGSTLTRTIICKLSDLISEPCSKRSGRITLSIPKKPMTFGDVVFIRTTEAAFVDGELNDEAARNFRLRKSFGNPKSNQWFVEQYGGDIEAHEAIHADQWARHDSIDSFLRKYLARSAASTIIANDESLYNSYEVEANLYWGGYLDPPVPIWRWPVFTPEPAGGY
jgi:RHS repeat-associated protein